MRLVVDADCLIAGTLTPTGATSELLDLWMAGGFELIVCPQLVHEVRKALLHPRIAGKYDISPDEAEGFATRLTEEGILLDDPVDPPRSVPDDPNDDYLVALAISSNADALVTRDRHFAKVHIPNMPIESPRNALEHIRETG